MLPSDWAEIAKRIVSTWPHQKLSRETLGIWFEEVADLNPEAVSTAIRAFARDGERFAPTGGQIRAKVLELDSDTLDHTAAYGLATEAIKHGGFYTGLTWLREQSDLAADAVEAFGWDSWCRDGETSEGTRRAQFRDCFNAVSRRQEKAVTYAGLPTAGLKSLEAGPKRLGDLVKAIGTGGTEAA